MCHVITKPNTYLWSVQVSVVVEGGRTVYVHQAPIRAALQGRLLILDGLEKAEQNVLPTLKHLLENQELSLDDSFMLLSADAFKRHDASNLNIRRVHPSFRKTCENHQLQVSMTHVFSSPWFLCQTHQDWLSLGGQCRRTAAGVKGGILSISSTYHVYCASQVCLCLLVWLCPGQYPPCLSEIFLRKKTFTAWGLQPGKGQQRR